MSELTALRAIRLKGRASRADLAATLGEDPNDIAAVVDQLVGSGLLIDGTALRVSPDGRARLEELLTEERRHIDTAALSAAYGDFRAVNAEFKALGDRLAAQQRTVSPTHTRTPTTTRPF